MPSLDDIIMNRTGLVSAHGFPEEGLVGMLKFLSDYPAQLRLLARVFPQEQVLVIDGERMVTVRTQYVCRAGKGTSRNLTVWFVAKILYATHKLSLGYLRRSVQISH